MTPVISKPPQLLFQRADQSLWLVPLNDGVGRQLTAALAPADDVITWSLSPDQQWLAYIQVKIWRNTRFRIGHLGVARLTGK